MRKLRLMEADSGRCLLPQVEVAETVVPRFLGLMGKRALAPGTGLYFPRCNSIHMFFMRFPIDVVYCRGDTVRKIVHALKPWRLSWCRSADACLEAPAGWAQEVGLSVGARIVLEQTAEEPQ